MNCQAVCEIKQIVRGYRVDHVGAEGRGCALEGKEEEMHRSCHNIGSAQSTAILGLSGLSLALATIATRAGRPDIC